MKVENPLQGQIFKTQTFADFGLRPEDSGYPTENTQPNMQSRL